MPSAYQETERQRQIGLHREQPELFAGAAGGARFMGKPRDFVLRDGAANLFSGIATAAVAYFKGNGIQWWGGNGPSGHLLSSQVACLNHLFGLRQDERAATAVLQGLDAAFVQALPMPCDADAGYVAFEVASRVDRLNEGTVQRGANNTSLDAAMLGLRADGARVLVAIEWKYTEHYGDEDKSADGRPDAGHSKGEVRKNRYEKLWRDSRQVRGEFPADLFREPFYQLFRQTLLLEQLVAHKDDELLRPDAYLHVHAVPSANADLLGKRYLPHGLGMQAHWQRVLVRPELYRVVDPRDLLRPALAFASFAGVAAYLRTRYWPV